MTETALKNKKGMFETNEGHYTEQATGLVLCSTLCLPQASIRTPVSPQVLLFSAKHHPTTSLPPTHNTNTLIQITKYEWIGSMCVGGDVDCN